MRDASREGGEAPGLLAPHGFSGSADDDLRLNLLIQLFSYMYLAHISSHNVVIIQGGKGTRDEANPLEFLESRSATAMVAGYAYTTYASLISIFRNATLTIHFRCAPTITFPISQLGILVGARELPVT